MSLLVLGLALLLGGVVGVLSGLLGIGGGILMVPFLYLLMAGPAWSGLAVLPEHQAALAHATSLFVIVPAAFSGFLAYRKAGVMRWRPLILLGTSAGVAAFLSARVAVGLPSPVLKALFGGFLILMAANLALGRKGSGAEKDGETIGDEPPPSRPIRWELAIPGGAIVGFLSALLGVGGGIVAVPFLIHGAGLELRRVAAASIGIVVFAASAGVVGYILAGRSVVGLPPGSLGFIHLPVGLALMPGAVLLAPLGTRINQRLPVVALRRTFAILLLVVGVRLLWTYGRALLGSG